MDLFLLSFIASMETYEQMNIKRGALIDSRWMKNLVDFDVVCDEVTVRPRANGCSGPDQTWFFSMGSRNKRFLA